MTEESALESLGLGREASPEEIEKTYRKLINRYPPEFHPDRFRRIDEAYRFLTSFPRRVASLFAPDAARMGVDATLFRYPDQNRDELLVEGVRELRRSARLRYLWETGGGKN